jgi:hypothetical protein
MAWALSSPVASSPDDDFHLASIWCGSGIDNLCQQGPEVEKRVVPEALLSSSCFAPDQRISASCQDSSVELNEGIFVTTQRGNFLGDYPPVYYFVLSTFAGKNIVSSVLLMRLFNSILFVGLAVVTFFVVSRQLRMPMIAGIVITMVPLAAFIVPSTNPSSWAVISAALLWPNLVTYFTASGTRRWIALVLAILLVVMGAGARSDSALFAVVAVGVAVVLTFKSAWAWWARAWIIPLMVIFAGLSLAISHQSTAVTNGLGPGSGDYGPLVLVLANLVEIPGLLAGIFGTWGLGWLDTVMPSSVWGLALISFSGAGFIAVTVIARRKVLAVVMSFAAVVIYPMALLIQSKSLVGANVQPRYILPLIIIFVGTLFLPVAGRRVEFSRTQLAIIAILIWIANSVALHTNIRRYVTGVDVLGWNLNDNVEWWWSFGPAPMTVWVVGTGAFGALLATLVFVYFRTRETQRIDLIAG